ncbi:MAG: acylphosphatase [Actinomycetes bacterium]
MIRRRVIVSGDVQGVFFRDTCRREALARGVAGWVRNRSDGSVEAVLEGDQQAVEAVAAWMRDGPPHASVTDVQVSEEQPAGERGFTVR